MATTEPRITLDPAVLEGKPVERGTRPSVEDLIASLAYARDLPGTTLPGSGPKPRAPPPELTQTG